MRITAQLIDATTGYHLWAERYDRAARHFRGPGRSHAKIVAALQIKLTIGEQGRPKRPPTSNMEAYDYFLRGLEYRSHRTRESNSQARQMFERAIALDPQFASAYAVLGLTYLTEIASQWNQDPHAADRLLQLAQHAVALDDAQPAAYETLAYAYLTKKQHDQAMTAAERAVTLDPNSADACQALGDVLIFVGRGEEAVALIEKAMRLNPRHPVTYLWTLGQAAS